MAEQSAARRVRYDSVTMTRRRPFKLGLLLLAFLLTGCSRDLSNAEPYKPLIGNEVTLVKEMELRWPIHNGEAVDGKPLQLTTRYSPGSTSSMDEHFAYLPIGSRLRIDTVKGVYVIKGWAVFVNGSGVLPDCVTEFKWTYFWGQFQGDFGMLHRAPWEHPDVPDRRRLRRKATVVEDWAE